MQTLNIKLNESLYLSPEFYNKIFKKTQVEFDSKSNDLFAFGVCLLETGLCKSVQKIYARSNGFDEDRL